MVEVRRQRIERVLDVLAQAVLGNYETRIPNLETAAADEFLDLEVATNMLLGELQASQQRNAAQLLELDQKSALLRQQQDELLRVLSTPIIVVSQGVLALPIVGTVEAERAMRMTESLLERVTKERATHVILDLTGAGEIALSTAQSLLRMAQALRLLGSRCILTGISPQMARTLIALHFDIAEVPAVPQLADALASVLAEKARKKTGQKTEPKEEPKEEPRKGDDHADSRGRR